MSIFDKINAGEYANQVEFSRRKEDPEGWQAYQTEEGRLRAKFMEDLAADLGIADHPKKDLLLAKAWENGHSSGYSDIANVAFDLVELIEEPKDGGETPLTATLDRLREVLREMVFVGPRGIIFPGYKEDTNLEKLYPDIRVLAGIGGAR